MSDPSPAVVLAGILRSTRRAHGLSQLELAARLGVSQRHLSFLEAARARPSRELLLAWFREVGAAAAVSNAALLQAGYPPEPSSGDLGGEVPTALVRLVDAHEPNVAFVFDALWRIRAANRSAAWIEGLVMSGPADDAHAGDMLYSLRRPQGMFSRLRDPQPIAAKLLRQLRAERLANPALGPRVDALEAALTDRFGALPEPADAPTPWLQLAFDTAVGPLAFSVLQLTTGLPQNVTVHSLRVELWYPADDQTAARVRSRCA